MARQSTELYFEPVSQGGCEALGCSNTAGYRAWWAQGIITKLVCATHKAEIEGKPFEELNPSAMFGVRATRQKYGNFD